MPYANTHFLRHSPNNPSRIPKGYLCAKVLITNHCPMFETNWASGHQCSSLGEMLTELAAGQGHPIPLLSMPS